MPRTVFADTTYWAGIIDPKDQYHSRAEEVSQTIEKAVIVTSELILIELLGLLRRHGKSIRTSAVDFCKNIKRNRNVRVIDSTTELFNKALELYDKRRDKTYSLVDCSSFVIMRELEIREALSFDSDFEKESFSLVSPS